MMPIAKACEILYWLRLLPPVRRLRTLTGALAYCDLSQDPELFEGTKGDVQVRARVCVCACGAPAAAPPGWGPHVCVRAGRQGRLRAAALHAPALHAPPAQLLLPAQPCTARAVCPVQ